MHRRTMNDPGPMSFEDVCRYAGQLFLETRHHIEQAVREAATLREELDRVRTERDDLLARLVTSKG